jgi:hypothetical protein
MEWIHSFVPKKGIFFEMFSSCPQRMIALICCRCCALVNYLYFDTHFPSSRTFEACQNSSQKRAQGANYFESRVNYSVAEPNSKFTSRLLVFNLTLKKNDGFCLLISSAKSYELYLYTFPCNIIKLWGREVTIQVCSP